MILITEVELKDEQAQSILDAICQRRGYSGFVLDENKEQTDVVQTQQEFLQQTIVSYIMSEYKEHISANAAAVAIKQVQYDIDNITMPELSKAISKK